MEKESYEYPIYFERSSLDGERRKTIEKYFNIRRKSGGGECSSITNIHQNLYSIAFKERHDQQRVLQRSEHVLKLAGGPLVLTVRSSPEPSTCSPITTSTMSKSARPKLDFTSSQSPQSIPAPTPPPSGEEYELRLDPYLLRYLKECPRAGEELEEELASVACSAQLYPEEERVVVSRLAQPGATQDVRNWKAVVDRIFDGYLCHYEVEDPRRVKALLQSCGSHQTTDEVKVYSEVGMAVVVGKRLQVTARLKDLEDRPGLSEKQTSIRRLGEAKLRLLWKEIKHSLQKDFPGVKVSQGAAGQLVMEGSVHEILKAGDWISEQENMVIERTVSGMSPHFLAFLRKAYGGPGALGHFLGVGDKVEVELRDMELRFFTLSADNLGDTEKKLHEKFKEVKIEVPFDLREKLKSKTNGINKGKHRAQVVFGSDNKVCLLGHTKEVDELSEVVTQLILDQASIEGKVSLPYSGLAQCLPELLQLNGFDYSGVTFHPLATSSTPMMVLEGPAAKVTEVRNRLGPFLDSIVQDRVLIDLPGAVRYFESLSGRDSILGVVRSQKCLVQLEEERHATRQTGEGLGGATIASYSLLDGFQVLVCQGDITKQDADALVNAANNDLDHGGGVAAALSKAGGPQVQKECRDLVKQKGKIPTGGVVMTTGGNLNCKRLLHAVGPICGKSGGTERVLLEKTVQSVLNLAEMMQFRSLAMPCISSGKFGVPVTVCSEAIVTAVKKFGSQGGRSLSRIVLIDTRGEVVKAMKDACDLLLQGISPGKGAPNDLGPQRGATAGAPEDGVHVEIVQGTIETQQVDVLVSPMSGHDPLSSSVGNTLSNVVGPQLAVKFHQAAGGATLPGDSVLVEGLPALRSKGVYFLNLVPWDNSQHGTAVQVLKQGIRKLLASCQIRGFSSVALPVLGTGAVLRFPHSTASRVVLEEIREFERNQISQTSFLVRIVIHPNDKDSSKAFQSAQGNLHLRGFTNDANPDQASFYRHVSVTDDEVTAMMGGVKLQMVCGDIIHESTNAIVSTTDFSHQVGVSKAIVTAAGPSVQAQLAQVGIPADLMCTTGPGLLGCLEIIHASFKCDPQVIRKNCKKILTQCESKGYQSVAFPAINTGMAAMDPAKACKAMLDGMTAAIMDLKPSSLTLIRIVILQQQVFQVFRSELENRFGQTAARHLSLREKAKQKLKKWHEKHSTTSTPQGETFTSSKPPPAVMSVTGCGPDAVRTVKRDLEVILQKQIVEREVDVQDFSRLDAMELEAVQAKVKVLGISLEHRRRQSSEGVNSRAGKATRAKAREQSGSGREVYVLRGLKEDVLSVIELLNRAIQEALCEDLQDKEEAMLALTVQWSIQDIDKAWLELSLHDNYMLEEAHVRREVSADVKAPDGTAVKVNLRTQEATNWQTGVTYRLKRSESESTLEVPPQWEPMDGEVFKKVELQSNSPEYQRVARGFLRTAKYNIHKIERVQNLYLWHAYSVCRQRISAKNGSAHLEEKFLYHGTSAGSCNCIEKDRFNRSYAGCANAAAYGKGVYFAVNAEYSAGKFSPADASGFKRLYVARVLTGRYTLGTSSMKATPPRGSDPTDCFDSLVNNLQQPSMFIIFHDDQAYPEYLITFK